MPRHAWFKAAVIALLVCNTAIFLATGTASEALDAAAWLVLLASFELETGWDGRMREAPGPAILRGVRLAAAIAILAAAIVAGLATWITLELAAPDALFPPQLSGLLASVAGMVIGSLLPQWYGQARGGEKPEAA